MSSNTLLIADVGFAFFNSAQQVGFLDIQTLQCLNINNFSRILILVKLVEIQNYSGNCCTYSCFYSGCLKFINITNNIYANCTILNFS